MNLILRPPPPPYFKAICTYVHNTDMLDKLNETNTSNKLSEAKKTNEADKLDETDQLIDAFKLNT